MDNAYMTKAQLINYLVDCNGYSEEQDLTDLNKEELEDLVTDWEQCKNYNFGLPNIA